MANKSFYQILEEQIRTDLRQEIEKELRAEYARAATTNSDSGAMDQGEVSAGILETWLVSKIGKTIFTRSGEAQRAYGKPTGSTRPSHTARAQDDKNASASTMKPTAPAITVTSVDDIVASELLKRFSGVNLGETFTETQLKAAWRRAAMKTHPDRFAQADAITQARTNATFRELCDAYDRLQAHFENAAKTAA